MRTALRHFVLRHFTRMPDVGNIHHMANSPDRDPVATLQFEDGGKNFIAHK
jgi:hypothetical protein